MQFLLVLVFSLFIPFHTSFAAPCCGGGAAVPTLITGDDLAQIQFGYAYGTVIGDAPTQGLPVFRASDDLENLQTLRLDGAYRISDRFQFGVGLPLVGRNINNSEGSASSWGLGDSLVDVGYEFLPEWTYSEWRPHGIAFLQLILPTGVSNHEANQPLRVDARGRGYYSLGGGFVLTKSISAFDFLFVLEVHHSFNRTVTDASQNTYELIPSFGGTSTLGIGFSPGSGNFRFGLSLSPIYEGSTDRLGGLNSPIDAQLVWNTSAAASYMINDEASLSFTYTDQTLMGPAYNVSLNRIFALSLQKRWPL